jgi:hypothetical protein
VNQKDARLKGILSPPPQQNTRINFHKPALDISRKGDAPETANRSPLNMISKLDSRLSSMNNL